MARILILLGLAAALSGCGSSREFQQTESYSSPLAFDDGQVVSQPVSAAFVRLPREAGRISAVTERRYANGVEQDITLADGERDNRLEIRIRTDADDARRGLVIPMERPTEEGIHTELAEHFPGVRMVVVTRSMSNSYGPFGLAIGRGAGSTRCIYGWQWIDDLGGLRNSRTSIFKKLGALASGETTDASIRLRLCRSGLTVDQLANAMSQLVIGGPGFQRTIAPVIATGDPQRPRSLESEIAPLPDYSSPLGGRRQWAMPDDQPRLRPQQPRRQVTAPQEPDAQNAQTYQQGGNRYLAPVPPGSGGPGSQESRVPSPSAVGQSPSYGAPPPPVPASPGLPRMPSSTTGSENRGLDPSLPDRAYSGPSRPPAQTR